MQKPARRTGNCLVAKDRLGSFSVAMEACRWRFARGVLCTCLALWLPIRCGAERVRLVTYNVENYLVTATDSRPAKSEAARAKVASVLAGLRPDVVAIQELGGHEALADLQHRLEMLGRPFPHTEWVQGSDTNIHIALLSRYPIGERRPHTRDAFLVSGRRFRVSRGVLEARVAVSPNYQLIVFVAHLKSRRVVPEADEAEMRREEARILRAKIDARLQEEPRANVVVLGDFNDTKDSETLRVLLGRGRHRLVDTRPAEANGDSGVAVSQVWDPRTVTWTHHFGREDSYSRIDYVLLHPNAAAEWVREETFLPQIPDWGLASDHRPLVVTLEARDR